MMMTASMGAPPASGVLIQTAGFEGPVDLLLSLIRKNQYEIRSLPIAEITRQYLEALEASPDLSVCADFVYMASTLIQMKSRALLPEDPELVARNGGAADAEREELVRQLLMREEQMRSAAEFLKQRLELAGATWSRGLDAPPDDDSLEIEPAGNVPRTLNLLEIARLAKKALEQARLQQRLEIGARGVTVEEMISFIEAELRRSRRADNLLERQPEQNRPALFLALLELAKAERIRLAQDEAFGPLLVEAVV